MKLAAAQSAEEKVALEATITSNNKKYEDGLAAVTHHAEHETDAAVQEVEAKADLALTAATSTIGELQSKMDSKCKIIQNLQADVDDHEGTIFTLEAEVERLRKEVSWLSNARA